ncbi:hypothetical protein MTBBW1_300063 [Desulfamplus magnetovallimortis]|uniref:Uncharacterized protein n=1 Tax=Desulfamplus magnetovallimortis TaxID=1246637 RepID=A0A1W1HG19_9BACT|nr:hypothetical protein MTBBW1_300063 [Desulfamplus magnetovallimortis]
MIEFEFDANKSQSNLKKELIFNNLPIHITSSHLLQAYDGELG